MTDQTHRPEIMLHMQRRKTIFSVRLWERRGYPAGIMARLMSHTLEQFESNSPHLLTSAGWATGEISRRHYLGAHSDVDGPRRLAKGSTVYLSQ